MKRIGMLLGLAAGLTLSGPAFAAVPVSPDVTAAFATYERITLIVSLVAPEPASAQAIRDRQQAVIDAIGPDLAVDTRYATIPALAVQVTAAGLAALQAHPLVTSIAPNRQFSTSATSSSGTLALAPAPIDPARAAGLPVGSLTPAARQGDTRSGLAAPQATRPPAPNAASALAQPANLRVIGAPAVWGAGHVGAGQFVAVLDSGIEASHPAFAGKTIVEACFSQNDPAARTFSLCPGRATAAAGPGTASACPDSGIVESCVHGSHVAGIATGNDPAARVYGVAPQADVVAVQVFHRMWDTERNRWDIRTNSIDWLAGLDFVANLAQSNPGKIASANMSLGGARIGTFCDELFEAGTDVINRLRDLRVSTVIAAGNDEYRGDIAFPACLSPAMAVAATDQNDVFSDNAGTNLANFPLVFIAAPGDLILSAIPGHRYARFSGTSMATPMVAGALAVLHSAYPGYQTFDYENALARTGKPVILDGAYRLPRLDLTVADAMLAGNVPGGSLSQPYSPSSPVAYIQSPARGNDAWSLYKWQLYVP